MFHQFHLKKYDIILIQEAHSDKLIEYQWKNEWGGKMYFDHSSSRDKGVIIMFRKEVDFRVQEVYQLKKYPGRFIAVKGTINGELIVLVNIYAPNTDSPEFFDEVFIKVQQIGVDRKIIGGDFNLILQQIDRKGPGRHNNIKASKTVLNYCEALNLLDIWRMLKPNNPGFTWRRNYPYSLFERLDLFLITDSMEQLVDRIVRLPAIRSDHSIVKLTLQANFFERGRSYRKLNTQLLRDPEYISKINKLIEIQLEQGDLYRRDHWEIIKLEIQMSTLQFSIHHAKSNRNIMQALEKKLAFWEEERDKIGYFNDQEEHIAKLKHEIQAYNKVKTQGAMLRCKARWEEMAEKPTKYFLNLEKARYNKKTILRIEDEDGKIVNEEKEIQAELTKFYSNLYNESDSETQDSEQYLTKCNLPSITDEQKAKLDENITMQELGIAVKELKNCKTPGVDGIPVDFYKFFWSKLKNFFLELIHEIMQAGRFHLTARRGIITLLEKIGRSLLKINNWHPITLLCTDFKIMDKIIARRLQTTLSVLIHRDQTGFQKGRQLGENVMKLLSIIEHCERHEISAVVLSVDFYKAFDMITWTAIQNVLTKYNFGPGIRSMIQLINKEILCTVMNNGKWGEWFQIKRGCRQGSPSSAIIYILVAETLGCKIRNNKNIKGIKVQGEEYKLGQYADDLWNILDSADSLDTLLEDPEKFQNFSGQRVNYEKSLAFKIGPNRRTDFKYITKKVVAWTDEPIKVLGIWIHPEWEMVIDANFSKLLKKSESVLKSWKGRGLSWMGKICVINTLVSPLFIQKVGNFAISRS